MKNNSIIYALLKEFRDILFAALLSIVITFSFAGTKLFTDFSSVFPGLLYGFMLSVSLWKGNQYVGWYVGRRFPWAKSPKRTLFIALASSFVFSLIATIIVNYIYLDLILGLPFFSKFSRFIWQIIMTIGIAMIITMSFYLAYFFKWWRVSIVNEERLKQEAIQLRYDALRNQVNPHFLFNSLSVLSALVDIDVEKAQTFIRKFSDIYRYVLEQFDKELVPLKVEMDFIASFVDLNLVRHEDNLKVEIQIDDFSGNIVPMSLQILVENSLKHNIISSEKPLLINISRENDMIVVMNKLQTKNVTQSHGGLGLETIKNRYHYLTDKPVIVDVTSEFFVVKIPIIDNRDFV